MENPPSATQMVGMAYCFKRSDIIVEAGVRRIALELVQRAIDEIDASDRDFSRAVHRVRTTCKKMRGLSRLIRSAFPAYDFENAALADIARRFSELRETDVLIATLAAIGEQVDDEVLPDIGKSLEADQRNARDIAITRGILDASRSALIEARNRIREWTLTKGGFAAIGDGLGRGYRKAARTLETARASGKAEDIHRWRTQVKYHGYHMLLLQDICPPKMKPRASILDRLGDMLGEHHDLAVLRDRIIMRRDSAADAHRNLFHAIDARQSSLAEAAFELGAVLFDEPAKPRIRLWRKWWGRWRNGETARGC